MKTFVKDNRTFLLLIVIYCLYAGLFIYRTSFVVKGERFFSLFDDAMISMRYAKNFAEGHGLIWNAGGERVEGYTNPLWVFYMSIFHLLPIVKSKISLCIQISGMLFLIINLIFVKKIADLISNNSGKVALLAVVFTAFYLPLNNYSLQGMEVSILTLIMSISIWGIIEYFKLNKFHMWIYILLGISLLIRIDMVVTFIVILLFFLIFDSEKRKRHIFLGLSTLIFFIFVQTSFRFLYYGDLLPNTYYLKLTGYPLLLRVIRGGIVFLEFVWRMNLIFFLIPFLMFLFKHNKYFTLMFLVIFGQVLYSIYVGGDAWEWWGGSNRYLCIVMPMFFILFSYSLAEIITFFNNKIGEKTTLLGKYVKYKKCVKVILVFIILVNFNAIHGPTALAEWLLINEPLHIHLNKEMVEKALILSEVTKDQAKIAVVWAGAIPYFSERYTIDMLGKNDKKIARGSMRVDLDRKKFIAFYPGHLKWNYSYSIGELKPDVVVQLWKHWEEAMPYLERDYTKVKLQGFDLYLLKGSNNILWDKIEIND